MGARGRRGLRSCSRAMPPFEAMSDASAAKTSSCIVDRREQSSLNSIHQGELSCPPIAWGGEGQSEASSSNGAYRAPGP